MRDSHVITTVTHSVCLRKRLGVTNAGHMYKCCWCLRLIKQLRSHWPLKWKAERGRLEIRNNKQSHPNQKHFNMPTNRKRRGGKCNRPKLNICQTWWEKNRDVFRSVFASMFLPVDSELHLWIIWHFFWQTRAGWKFQGPFSWQARISIFEYAADFSKTSGSRMHWSRVELLCFLFFPPNPLRERIECVLHFILRGVASDEVYFSPLQIQTRPGK